MGFSNLQAEGLKGASKNLGRGNQTTKPKKNTVASLLAQTRRDSEQGLASSHPELTIEPIFRSTPSQVRIRTAKVLLQNRPSSHCCRVRSHMERTSLTRVWVVVGLVLTTTVTVRFQTYHFKS